MFKKIYILVLFFSSMIIFNNVKAEDFYEGDYFTTYVKKIKDNKTYYLTMQTLRDRDNGNKLVYCLEPFKFFNSATSYKKIYDSSEYSLSKEQMDRIRKIAYYGFGYQPKNRRTNEWYAITQVLIWKTVDPDADIFFTSTLNGEKDEEKYQDKINALLNDVDKNKMSLNLNDNYQVVYNNSLELYLGYYYDVIDSNLDYTLENNVLKINNIKKNGYLTIRENANNYYDGEEIIYDSDDSQDLYLPSKLKEKTFTVNVEVIKGDITLNINKDKDTYSVDADFSNTCYGIFKDGNLLQKICANDEYKYKTEELEIGEYEVKQLSTGIGYIEDKNIYSVSINEFNLHPVVNLFNYIKSNDVRLSKKYCDFDKCKLENGAVFDIYDSKNNYLNSYETDNMGVVTFKLGYGAYDIVQTQGLEGFKYVDSFKVFVLDDGKELKYDLYDRKEVIDEEETKKEDNNDEKITEEDIVPKKETIDELQNDEEIENDIQIEEDEEIVCFEENIQSNSITPPYTGIIFVFKNNKWVKMIVNNVLDYIRKYARFAILL